MANLQYKHGIPFVWVVKREYGTSVFFEEKNARKCYFEEFRKLKSEGYKVFVSEDSGMTYSVLERPNGERVFLSVGDTIVSDHRD